MNYVAANALAAFVYLSGPMAIIAAMSIRDEFPTNRGKIAANLTAAAIIGAAIFSYNLLFSNGYWYASN